LSAELGERFIAEGATFRSIRVVDLDVFPGTEIDMGDGDDWPDVRAAVLDADVLLIATPIWLGHPSSVCQRVMERLNADLSTEGPDGRRIMEGRVACVAVVGNEDGAHFVASQVFQGLNDIGFTIPAGGCTYWVGEAMGDVDYLQLDAPPEKTADVGERMVDRALRLAELITTSGADEPAGIRSR
jgi:multimeric flavodoxin WrbA